MYTEDQPLVSIGMPVYNCEGTVRLAIESIVKQSYTNWELIVIDDGSKDRTVAAICEVGDPRIHVVTHSDNKGLPVRLNEAVTLARGPYFARMDGDDISYPERLQLQVSYLVRHKEIDVLGGAILILNAHEIPIGLRLQARNHAEICRRPWRGFGIPHVTWMGKTTWFRSHPYNGAMTHAQDRDLLMRGRSDSQFAALENVLVAVREPPLSWHKQWRARRQFMKAMAKQGVAQNELSLLFIGIPIEGAKFLLDAIAIVTGLQHHLLRHRVPHCPEFEKQRWLAVLDTLASYRSPAA